MAKRAWRPKRKVRRENPFAPLSIAAGTKNYTALCLLSLLESYVLNECT